MLLAAELPELSWPYAVCELLVAVGAILGNGLVILVFARERKLRRRTNYYIISLAAADLLVGLFAIPFAILESVGLPRELHACLFTVSVLVVLCTISIFCLVAVSVDRYWAVLHPMGYSRTMRTKTAIGIICACWLAGSLVGFLPLLGWNSGGYMSAQRCVFTEVMDYDYLLFLYFATIIFPALLIGAFYAHIYRVVLKQLQQIVTVNPGCKRSQNEGYGTMLRLLGAAQKREVKATQNLSRIVLFFIICWFPLYTINCVQAFCSECRVDKLLLDFCIILSHLNSAGNPLLYAYHLKDFRAALKSFIQGLLLLHQPAGGGRSTQLRARSRLVAAPPAPPPLERPPHSKKPSNISVITDQSDSKCNNTNTHKTTKKNDNDNGNGNSKSSNRPPLSILGCRGSRDTASVASRASSSPNPTSRLASLQTLELRTCEFEAALRLVSERPPC